MSEQKTVTINGKVYDASTGKPLNIAKTPTTQTVDSNFVHAKTQKSTTLNRKYTKKPIAMTAVQKAQADQFKKRQAAKNQTMDFLAHKKPALQPIKPASTAPTPIKPAPQPEVYTAHPKQTQVNTIAAKQNIDKRHLTAIELKDRAITQAFAKIADAPEPAETAKKKRHSKKQRKLASILSMSAAVLLLVAYFTYLNLPNISLRIAAMQGGVAATYPSYQPSGYSLNGLVAYNGDTVNMKFASGNSNYKIAQSKSSWDSNAVLRNYVTTKWGNDYSINKGRGLTIYMQDNKAAWVNGGVFYVIEATHDLSSDQIEKIAVSL
ncbi:hypothetical protein FWF48_03390 [Candidatus Saccharibacteria bacterium]|nr:hypothetical protein [Candidatus Saccharibacteria bacterium]